MQIVRKFKTRFGKEVIIKKTVEPFRVKPGERFTTALVRHYYPADYRRIHGKAVGNV